MSAPPPPPSVLVIDDDPANLSAATVYLRQYAYRVLTARDGESGLRRARHAEPDLILLDIQMPGIDGYETCRRLKAHPDTAHIPVIYATALASLQDKLRAFELGGVDYVTKPFEASELLARVRTHLTLVAQQRRLQRQAEELDARVREATADYRRESERLQAALADKDGLLDLARIQGQQVQQLTEHWLDDRSRNDVDLARYQSTALSERLRLLAGELAQAAQLAGEGPAAEPLRRARDLLAPALRDSGRVQDELEPVEEWTENPLSRLSAREHEVFRLLAAGKANREICKALGLRATTVSTYRSRILEKLEVDDIAALVVLSLRFPNPPA